MTELRSSHKTTTEDSMSQSTHDFEEPNPALFACLFKGVAKYKHIKNYLLAFTCEDSGVTMRIVLGEQHPISPCLMDTYVLLTLQTKIINLENTCNWRGKIGSDAQHKTCVKHVTPTALILFSCAEAYVAELSIFQS